MLVRKEFTQLKWWMIALTALCAGCGGSDGLERVAMYGKVTLDGASLASGSISLLPAPTTEGPAANGLIRQGEYQFDRSNGPVAGEYHLLVIPGEEASAGGKADNVSERVQRRREWRLTVDIPSAKSFEHNISLPQ